MIKQLLDPFYFIEGRHEHHILGSIISAGASLLGGAMANKQSKDNVQAANQFTTEQMKNRHQWEVQDLRAAGLNPILSALNGAPSMGGSPVAPVQDIMGPAVNSALAAKRLSAEVDKMKADTRAADASAAASKGVAANQLSQAASTAQLMDIKKPAADLMRGVGDISNSALSLSILEYLASIFKTSCFVKVIFYLFTWFNLIRLTSFINPSLNVVKNCFLCSSETPIAGTNVFSCVTG